MTEFDRILIAKAERLRPWDYSKIGVLIDIADTEEARKELLDIRMLLYELMQETL